VEEVRSGVVVPMAVGVVSAVAAVKEVGSEWGV